MASIKDVAQKAGVGVGTVSRVLNNSLAEVHFLKPHPVYEHWYPVFAVMIGTTLNIYADVTKEMKAEEFKGLDSYFKV